jgi:hypothetical protein
MEPIFLQIIAEGKVLKALILCHQEKFSRTFTFPLAGDLLVISELKIINQNVFMITAIDDLNMFEDTAVVA